MEEFARDLLSFQSEWPIWKVLSMNEVDRLVKLSREDEFPAVVEITIPRFYPQGKVLICNVATKATYESSNGQRISEAIDNALLQWDEEEGAIGREEPHHRDDHNSYEDAVVQMANNLEAPEVDEEGSHSNFQHQFFVKRTFGAWTALANQLHRSCKVILNSKRRCITLFVFESIRCIDPLRCIALSLRDAEYLVIHFDIPLAFPAASPITQRVFLCNNPDTLGEDIGNGHGEGDDKIGVFGWFVKHRLDWWWRDVTIKIAEVEGWGCQPPLESETQPARPLSLADAQNPIPLWEWIPRDILLGDEQSFTTLCQRLAACNNPIGGAYEMLLSCIVNSTRVCFVCGDTLPVEGMQLGYCKKELCSFSVERLGLGVDVLAEVTKKPEVFELLMQLAYASIANGDKRDFFNPMCNVDIEHTRVGQRYKGPKNFYIGGSEKKGKNFQLLLEVIQRVPSVPQLVQIARGSNATLKHELNLRNPLMYPLIQWIISSNRSHVQHIPPLHQVKGLGPHQFLLINHSPDKEQRFRLLIAAAERVHGKGKGSFFAWHGSSTSNWHCILREGLHVYSGTKFMSSGQVYGTGIYLARSVSTSIPYMATSKGSWAGCTKLAHPQGCSVLALAEVAMNTALFRDHNNDIITVSDEDAICTRFVFVFPGNQVPISSLALLPSNDEIAAQLKTAFPFV